MPADLHLTLVLPGLLWPHQDIIVPVVPLPALDKLRHWGQFSAQTSSRSQLFRQYLWQGSWVQQVCGQYNLDPSGNSLIATPISQTAGMHQLQYIDGKSLSLSIEEASAFCSVLNKWLQAENWQFHPVKANLWLLTSSQRMAFSVPSILDLGGSINSEIKPTGTDALLILQRQTELQMLLYQHPINQQRSARGLPTINSLWFEPDSAGTADSKIPLYTNSSWAVNTHELPANYAALADTVFGKDKDKIVLFNDALCTAVNQGDVYLYTQILQQWEQDWWQPLLNALQNKQLRQLNIHCENGLLQIRKPWLNFFRHKAKPFNGLCL